MNTSINSMKFVLIPAIFLTLGFIVSCNDDIISSNSNEKKIGVNDIPIVTPPTSTTTASSTTTTTEEDEEDDEDTSDLFPVEKEDNLSDEEMDKIDIDDLSKKIKEIKDKIQESEKEKDRHHDEYDQMVDLQKKILNEIKEKKIVMISKPEGSKEQIDAKKDFEDQKELGKEKLEVLKKKNRLLNNIYKSIRLAIIEKEFLEKRKEKVLKRKKEKEEKRN
ncbi:hypothetical protein [Blattabacterium cuenoti]|uniref:hypothetical protein n=1 Tax=Blattabacterium cuenoti TaxID=1653831 RepID=UPI00163BAFFC|nr:hypothetical protein [Blattabacterium cuenoti]